MVIFGLPELPGKPLRITFNIPGGCSWGDFAQKFSNGHPVGREAHRSPRRLFLVQKIFSAAPPRTMGSRLDVWGFGPFCAHVLSSRLLGRKSRNFIILSNFLNYDHDSRKLTHDTTLVEI